MGGMVRERKRTADGGRGASSSSDRRSSRHSLSPARRPSRKAVSHFDRQTDEEKEKRVRAHLQLTPKQLIEQEMKIWTRAAPADLYYQVTF